MKESGWALVGLGVLLLIGSLFVDVSRSVGYVPSGLGYGFPREVANIHAMHIQSLIFHGGLAAILAGTITIGFGEVVEILGTTDRDATAQAEPVPDSEPVTSSGNDVPDHSELPLESDSPVWWALGIIAAILIVLFIIASSISSPSYSPASDDLGNDMMMDPNSMDMGIDLNMGMGTDTNRQ
jgi:hypothetical protein